MPNKPYIVQETAGTKAYCACGKSNSLPHCDGSHKDTGITPHVVKLDEDKAVAICACGHTGNAPYCDGSHAKH